MANKLAIAVVTMALLVMMLDQANAVCCPPASGVACRDGTLVGMKFSLLNSYQNHSELYNL